ncbi:MAG: L-2-amino-thiazoline-4-carboxylic acid hydrolase [Chloroflexi bacterium]|nr:L-2-amino-thiazoline-4-carboxylic acid hydrolase [Chloroflexota bacterium]
MKDWLSRCVGLVIALPYALAVWGSSLFVGKKKAVEFWGPYAAFLAKHLVVLSLPRMRDASEFDQFGPKLEANLWAWRSIYDVSVKHLDDDTVQLYITNCPFCETFDMLRLSEMNPFVCQGDWVAAEVHSDKWGFERTHQIGTGDAFCDHTYKRLKPETRLGG